MNINKIQNFNMSFSANYQRKDDVNIQKKLTDILLQCIQNAETITFSELVEKSGYSASTVSKYINRKHSIVSQLWIQMRNIPASTIRTAQLKKGNVDKSYYYPKVVKILKEYQSAGYTKVPYSIIENRTGLNKEQINDCVKDYMNYLNMQTKLRAETKARQQQWYNENKDKQILPYEEI